MSYPIPKNNNFIKNNVIFIDNVSKVYIALGCIFGINRITLFEIKFVYKFIGFAYAMFVCCVIVYLSYISMSVRIIVNIITSLKVLQFILLSIIGSTLWKRVLLYYKELNNFDADIGYKPKTASNTWIVLAQLGLLLTLVVFLLHVVNLGNSFPLYTLYCIEIHYFAHLTTLLCTRIRLLQQTVESMIPSGKLSTNLSTKQVKIKQLMGLYSRLIDAHDLFVDAMKWQIAPGLVLSFMFQLIVSYNLVIRLQANHWKFVFVSISLLVSELATTIAPCVYCDQVRTEIRRFRELLSSTLYDSKLDKSDRNHIRGVLELSDNHDLSFSLLRMIDVSISLPFTFIGLLLTYLIILLQFQKVISFAIGN